MMTWLNNVKNALFASVTAALALAVVAYRFALGRSEKREEAAEDRNKGYEAADATRNRVTEAVKVVRRKAAAQKKPNVKKRSDLDNSW